MAVKLFLIGQAPARGGDPARPLLGVRSAKRLQELCEMTPEEYEGAFDRANLLPKWLGNAGKGDKFDMKKARAAAGRMLPRMVGRRVILLGQNVAQAFGLEQNYLEWVNVLDARIAVLPHPSGVNRWWNDKTNLGMAKAFMLDATGRLCPSGSCSGGCS